MIAPKKLFKKKLWITPIVKQKKIQINLFFSSRGRNNMNEIEGSLMSAVSCATCNQGSGCMVC